MREDIRTDLHGAAAVDVDPVSKVLYVAPAISWRAIFAGTFVGILTYLALAALGMALGGLSAELAIEAGEGGTALSIGTAVWLLISGLAALFVGGFIAARTSGVIPTRIGGIEGLVVASLFFVLMLTGVGAGLGALSGGITSVAKSVGGGATSLAGSPQVQSIAEGALDNLNLRGDPTQIVQGVTARLLRGDEQGAMRYLSRQTGISQQEASQRLGQVKGQLMATANQVGQGVARATQIAGWALFAMILLGSAAALFGGVFGARRNIRRPLSDRDRKMAIESRGEWYPSYPTSEPVPRGT